MRAAARRLVFVLPLLLAGAGAAIAQGAPSEPMTGRAALAACRDDMHALCQGAGMGGGRKFACLKDHQDKLSTGCKAALSAVVAKHAAGPGHMRHSGKGSMAVCREDVARVCAGVEKGQGRIGQCLNDNAAKLSQPCAEALASGKAARHEARKVCQADAATLCGGEKGPRRMACLKEKQSQLSQPCRDAMAAVAPQGR